MDERHAFYANIFRHVTKYIFIYSLLIEIVGVYIIAIVNLANPMYQPRLIGINFTIFRTLGSFCFGTLCFISILYKLIIRNVNESSNSDWCVFLYLISEIIISIIVTTFLIENPDYDKRGILIATVCNFYSFVGINIIFGIVSYFHAPYLSRHIPSNDGLDDNSIEKIPIYRYKKGKIVDNDNKEMENISNITEQCIICLQDYKTNDKLILLECKHYYHKKCCEQWLSINKSCPICRKIVDVTIQV